ncbi:GntR family transcriptional regulator [Tritonibacter horizontis]|uniref:HTH-type transcriptional regulator McbR n=1 Tax=Tritonibacter horizontis TaxID=1768241 RepID=A0A132BZV2_9RHOB|nr:GntR family transcriptional regulator [Tritonibacter horizontis]KUP93387.1 HTH-type transcriptional regulator McbR [Tritonibacter horizontis]
MSLDAGKTVTKPSRSGNKIRKLSASQQIHAAMRARIIDLDLAPGQNLSRLEIAEYYGVSQTPVRDAMMRLEEEGLLHIYPQSKTEVSKIDTCHARETQFLRLSLEIEVTRRLIASTRNDALAGAERALQRQQQALDLNDLDSFSIHDRAFHRALFEATQVPDLWDLVTERSGHIDRLRKLNLPDPGKTAEIIACHHRILDAIKAADNVSAEAAVREHLSGTLARVDAIMARHPEFF